MTGTQTEETQILEEVKINLLTQLIQTLKITIKKLEESYNRKDIPAFKKTKEEILKIKEQVSNTLEKK